MLVFYADEIILMGTVKYACIKVCG